MSIEHIGSRLKSEKPMVMFRRFPNSDTIVTIPPGKPSPVIDSFLANGFYQVKRPGDKDASYIKKTPDLEIVPPDEPDESGLIDGFTSGISDLFFNARKTVQKNAGFLSDGFKESVEGLTSDIFSFGKGIKTVLFLVIAILTLWLLIQINE